MKLNLPNKKVMKKFIQGKVVYVPKLRELLEDILPQVTSFDDFEVEHNFPHIGKRTMLLNARKIYKKAKEEKLILLAIEDITERKKAEKK